MAKPSYPRQFFYEITEVKYLKLKLMTTLNSVFEEIIKTFESNKIYNQVKVLDIVLLERAYF